jgi:hypothetical protein
VIGTVATPPANVADMGRAGATVWFGEFALLPVTERTKAPLIPADAVSVQLAAVPAVTVVGGVAVNVNVAPDTMPVSGPSVCVAAKAVVLPVAVTAFDVVGLAGAVYVRVALDPLTGITNAPVRVNTSPTVEQPVAVPPRDAPW